MSNYKYGYIDMELINHKNVSMLKKEELVLKELLSINILSIFKLIDNYDFDIPVLLFDSKPYFKSKYITEYKTNRKHYTEVDLEGLARSSIEYIKIEYELLKNKLLLEAKQYMINKWGHFTIPIIYSGLEADDLSFMISRLVTDKSIHITKDTDYKFHIYPNHDVLILSKNGNNLIKYDLVEVGVIPLEYQKVFYELFKKSHNGIHINYELNISNEELYKKYLDNTLDKSIIDRINGLNPLTYFNEEIKDFLLKRLNRFLNPDINYLKSYKYLSYKRINDIQQRQVLDNFFELENLFM